MIPETCEHCGRNLRILGHRILTKKEHGREQTKCVCPICAPVLEREGWEITDGPGIL